MSEFRLSNKSIVMLEEVHKDLKAVTNLAIEKTRTDFCVIEGIRNIERQKELVADGKSKTMDSRHITGHAVDLVAWVDGAVSWEWQYYINISEAMKSAAEQLRVSIVWGGDWGTFKDNPHFQLSRMAYPAAAPMEHTC